jgi:hypothetical protein
MTRIDRLFNSTAWEEIFPTAHLHAWMSTVSDHCLLILQGETDKPKFKGFKFETFWLAIPGFGELVKQAWEKPLQTTNPIRCLHIKLSCTTKALKK